MPCNCLHEQITSNTLKAKLWAAFKLIRKNLMCSSIFQHLCPSYVPGNLPLLCPVIQRMSGRTASLLWLYLFWGISSPFPLSFAWERNDPKVTRRKEWGRVEKKNRMGKKKESSLSMRSARWAREKEASSKSVPHSCATAGHAVTGAAMGGCSKAREVTHWCAFSPWIGVETSPQEQQGGRKASRGRKADGDRETGDWSLVCGWWEWEGIRRKHEAKEK